MTEHASFLYSPTLTSIHDHWKNHSFVWTFVGKGTALLFNMLSRLVIAFLPRSKRPLISWLYVNLTQLFISSIKLCEIQIVEIFE